MKVNAYRCDRCNEWVDEDGVTHGVIDLKGRVTAKYKVDLCLGCAEKEEPKDVEPEPTATRTVLPRVEAPTGRYRRNPEQVAEALKIGTAMLADDRPLTAVLARLEITESTWKRWNEKVLAASASRSASGDGL